MFKRIFLLLFFFTLSAVVLARANFKVFAQEKSGFAVSPPSFEINANPGDVIKNTIKIDNHSSFPLKIKTKAQNFVAYGEGGQVHLTDEESPFAIANWIKLIDKEQIIAPKSFALFDFELNIPKNAEPGSHYGAIVFYTEADTKVKNTAATLSQEIGSLILIKIPGKVFERAKIISFKPENQVFKDTKIKLLALIENEGNVHIKPYGFINISNLFGQKIKTVEVKGRNILPGSRRIFDEEFKLDKIGYFKAEINLLYSGGDKIMKEETNFIALNLVVLRKYLITGLIVLIIYFILRKRINRALKIIFTGK